MIVRCACVAGCVMLLCACTGYGARTIRRDHFNYNSAISNAWQTQMLLNIVKLRYADTPVFLDVAGVVNQYELQSEVGLEALNGVESEQGLGVTGTFTDKPTITYNPIKGEKFTRSLLTPVPAASIFSLIQASWPADIVFRITVHSMNGLNNRSGGITGTRIADPDFYKVIEAMRRIQVSNSVSFRVRQRGNDRTSLVVFRSKKARLMDDDIQLVRSLLGIKSEAVELSVTFGTLPRSDTEIAIVTRSMMEMLISLASYIEVPPVHVDEGRADPPLPDDGRGPLIRILSSSEQPDDALVKVYYRNHWFWVPDTDMSSKRMFTALLFMFSLVETGDVAPVAPVLTIPAG